MDKPARFTPHLEKIESPPENDVAMTRARLFPLFFSRAAPSYSRSLYSRRRELSSRLRRTAKPPNRRTLKFHNPGVYASVLLHQLIVRDGPALAGLFHAGDDLVAGEGFNHARAFDDLERRRFQGRETLLAVRALATTPDRGAVVRDARVDDARVRVMTERTVHPSTVHAPSARCHRSPASHFTEQARRRADRAAELR